MDTRAGYWEARIKTYGFQKETDLSLLEVVIEQDRIAEWGQLIQELGDGGTAFLLVVMQTWAKGRLQFHLLLRSHGEEEALDRLKRSFRRFTEIPLRVTTPVEMIHFQGPHFGDRFGIAEAAFRTLDKRDIPILTAACSGASVYVVLPENTAQRAQTSLEEAFEVPRRGLKPRGVS